MLTVGDLPELELTSEELATDPLAVFDRLRGKAWVARGDRGLEVFSHPGLEAAYQNVDLIPGIGKLLAAMATPERPMSTERLRMTGTEGSDHTRFRRVVSRWFTPRRVDELRPRVRALVESLVEPVTASGGAELMTAVMRRVPGRVFCWMIGASDDYGDRFFEISELLISAFEGDASKAQEIFDAGVEGRALVDELIAEKRRRPTDDLLSILVAAADAGDISIGDARSLTYELLAASTDNTAHAAGLAVSVLAAHPDQWQLLHTTPGLVASAVEECLRVEPRIRFDTRYTADGTTLLDLAVPADTMLYLQTAAANVDPDVYPNPRRFDITRGSARPHLNFGIGRHYCMGAALARVELQEILATLATRWAALGLDSEPEIKRRNVGSVERLPITCKPT